LFAIQIHKMNCFSSHAAAAAYFAKTTPFKDSQNRPLENKRMSHKALVKHADSSFSARLYRTDMVTFYKDGNVGVQFDGRQSSVKFSDCFVPKGMHIKSSDGMVLVVDGNTYRSNTELIFEPDQESWKLLNPQHADLFTKKVVDRKKAAAARKLLKPFLEWATTYLRLKPSGPDADSAFNDVRDIMRDCGDEIHAGLFPIMLAWWVKYKHSYNGKSLKTVVLDLAYQARYVVDVVTLPLGKVSF
jgi:hypothetical protein